MSDLTSGANGRHRGVLPHKRLQSINIEIGRLDEYQVKSFNGHHDGESRYKRTFAHGENDNSRL